MKTEQLNLTDSNVVEIHYILPTGPMSGLDNTYKVTITKRNTFQCVKNKSLVIFVTCRADARATANFLQSATKDFTVKVDSLSEFELPRPEMTFTINNLWSRIQRLEVTLTTKV